MIDTKKEPGPGPVESRPPAAQSIAEHTVGETKTSTAADFGKVWFAVGPDGKLLKPFAASIRLFERAGHLYKVPGGGKAGDRWGITMPGYSVLNKVASVSVLTPPCVSFGGREVSNPYVERNAVTRAIESVIIRKVALGMTPVGNVVVIDKTLYYNPYTYFLQSIQAKARRKVWEMGKMTNKLAHPDAARLGTKDVQPEGATAGRWIFKPIDETIGYWINIDDSAIQEVIDEHLQRQRFGDRIAQTICARNALKDHPAIAVSQVQPEFVYHKVYGKDKEEAFAEVSITVYGYRHELGRDTQENIMLSLVMPGTSTRPLSGPVEHRRETLPSPLPEDEAFALKESAEEEDAELGLKKE